MTYTLSANLLRTLFDMQLVAARISNRGPYIQGTFHVTMGRSGGTMSVLLHGIADESQSTRIRYNIYLRVTQAMLDKVKVQHHYLTYIADWRDFNGLIQAARIPRLRLGKSKSHKLRKSGLRSNR